MHDAGGAAQLVAKRAGIGARYACMLNGCAFGPCATYLQGR